MTNLTSNLEGSGTLFGLILDPLTVRIKCKSNKFLGQILSEIYCSSVSSNSSNSSASDVLLFGRIGTKMIVILRQLQPKDNSISVFRTNGS